MLLAIPYEGLEIHREEKLVYGRFLTPHAVLSTSRHQGGYQEGLEYLGNHQSCEPAGHQRGLLAVTDPAGYQAQVLSAHGLPPDKCALLGTAANMRLLSVKSESFEELTVVAAITGGVESNAARAGDPAVGHEGPAGYRSLSAPKEPKSLEEAKDPYKGTINILTFINRPLTAAALVRAISLVTEAKTCALGELGVNSRYSAQLASGTGTDQMGVAAKLIEGVKPLVGGGHHLKLGELLGRVTHDAAREVLIRQNGMTPDRQCSVKILLERFNERPDGRRRLSSLELVEMVGRFLPASAKELLTNNYRGFFHDPWIVAATMAMTSSRDQFVWGVLPVLIWPEVMGAFAGQLAAAVSGRLDLVAHYAQVLSPSPSEALDDGRFLQLVARGLALGLVDKWA
ncbi:MAG: adenosylcobinamide amidohydrolase [Deltaproteobacteria bacterium]|jgi:adenosylcobinamide amidohydrolase|nr:adenosylcobinamide amidohydrolase [Deltaproteobacteria bacterium]